MWLATVVDFGIPLIAGMYCAALGANRLGTWSAWVMRLSPLRRRLIGALGIALVVVTLLRMAMALYLAHQPR